MWRNRGNATRMTKTIYFMQNFGGRIMANCSPVSLFLSSLSAEYDLLNYLSTPSTMYTQHQKKKSISYPQISRVTFLGHKSLINVCCKGLKCDASFYCCCVLLFSALRCRSRKEPHHLGWSRNRNSVCYTCVVADVLNIERYGNSDPYKWNKKKHTINQIQFPNYLNHWKSNEKWIQYENVPLKCW
jgi:hypothetical protein